ncbi:interleukin-15 receptor subunit alpha isoform X3 [Misgurnus anguillicaudatus]|uniref:interleukin-15 receptor subunit alpha isoform X3 n=1 Tax=Misgurnus anguillicaudatus TaxID=75329 RepID=UPI003CCF2B74
MHVLVIFIFVTAEYHHNIVGASGVCEPLIQENNTMPADSISKPVNTRIRTRCKEGYLRKAGTSEMYRCTEKYGKLIWINDLKIVCIPDPRIPPDSNSGKMADPKPDSTSIIGVAAGIMIVCLVSAAAAAAVLWWRCKRRATNPANEIELDHTNYAACITYIPVPVSEHCSAEPPDMDAAANKSTTDSQTE